MRRAVWIVLSISAASPVLAQQPAPLPQAIVPAAAANPVSPLDRFKDFAKYPPETLSVVDSYRSATIWLGKMHQVHGRFLPGLDPALASKLDSDNDAAQAVACLALCQAARLNPDPATTAKAKQAVLALLAVNKARDAALVAEKVLYAAAMSLAIREWPATEAPPDIEVSNVRTTHGKLLDFLRTATADNLFPIDPAVPGSGLALQAIAPTSREKPDEGKNAIFVQSAMKHRDALKAKPNTVEAAVVLVALIEGYDILKNKDLAMAAFELADTLVLAQYGTADPKVPGKWVGGFRGPAEPGFEVAIVARGLAAATRFTRQNTTDAARAAKYRQATLNALAFVQSLQYTDDNSTHFEAKFRTQFLLGGVRTGLTNPTLRVDSTAWAALACAAFLESGAEGRE